MASGQETEFVIRARDEASAVITKIASQYKVSMKEVTDAVNSASGAEGAASDAIGKHSLASNRLVGVIKEERQEMRMRNFALRESAGAIDQLSTMFVGPAGLGNSVKSGISSFYELDFALKAAGASAGGMGGKIGMIGGFLGSVAVPVSVAVGAVAILVGEFNEMDKQIDANLVKLQKLNAQLTHTEGLEALTAAAKRYLETITRPVDPGWWTLILYGLNEQLGKEHLVKDLQVQATQALVDGYQAQLDMIEATKKLHEEEIKGTKTRQSNNALFIQNRTILLDIEEQENGRNGTLKKRLALATEEISNLQFFRDQLQAQHAPYADIETIENNILTKTKERLALAKEYKEVLAGKMTIGSMTPDAAYKTLPGISSVEETNRAKEMADRIREIMKDSNASDMRQKLADLQKWESSSVSSIKKVANTQVVETTAAQLKIDEGWQTAFQVLDSGFQAVGQGAGDWMQGAFERSFGVADTLLAKFTEAVLVSMARIAAESLAKQAIGGLFSLIPGGGAIAAFLGFHDGGTIPRAHEGAYINAPSSREFPILVRGGETVRTEKQEQEAQARMNGGGGASSVVNVYISGITDVAGVKRVVQQGLRETGLTVDKFFVNNRSNLVLSAI